MVNETPRLGLNTYEQGDENWSHTDAVEAVDEHAIKRGSIADRPAEGEYDDELFAAIDQRIIWRWDESESDWRAFSGLGSDGEPVPETSYFEALEAGSASIEQTSTNVAAAAADAIVLDDTEPYQLRDSENAAVIDENDDIIELLDDAYSSLGTNVHIHLSSGIYSGSPGEITMSNGGTLSGAGRRATQISWEDGTLDDPATAMIQLQDRSFIQDVRFSGNRGGVDNTNANTEGIDHTGDTFNAEVRNVEVQEIPGGDGIDIDSGCNDWLVHGCYVHDIDKDGIHNSGGFRNRFIGNTVENCEGGRGGFTNVNGAEGSVFIGNIARNNPNGNYELTDDCIANNNQSLGNGVENDDFSGAGGEIRGQLRSEPTGVVVRLDSDQTIPNDDTTIIEWSQEADNRNGISGVLDDQNHVVEVPEGFSHARVTVGLRFGSEVDIDLFNTPVNGDEFAFRGQASFQSTTAYSFRDDKFHSNWFAVDEGDEIGAEIRQVTGSDATLSNTATRTFMEVEFR